MRLTNKRRVVNPDTNEDKRPSHWHDDQNERETVPLADYPTDVVEEPELGFVPPPDPVPVYMTEPLPSDQTLIQWSPQSAQITTTDVRIAGADRRRRRMVCVNNDDTDTIYLSRRNGDLTINAYPLKPGKDVELLHNDEVWANTTANDAELGWFIEYALEDL